ncbi:MAG: hypothetical protein JSU92_13020 [Deltaproteobacteria bacterium]|nr:MAG: hypothetical protein JSU92_13020 [Deltaproteobacteria bacterium]
MFGKMKIHHLLMGMVSILFLFSSILFGFCPERVFIREGLKIVPHRIKTGEQARLQVTVKRPGRSLSIKTVELLSPRKEVIYSDDTIGPSGETMDGERVSKYDYTYDSKSIPLTIGDQFKPGENWVRIEVGYYYAYRDDKGNSRWDYEKSRFESSFYVRQ